MDVPGKIFIGYSFGKNSDYQSKSDVLKILIKQKIEQEVDKHFGQRLRESWDGFRFPDHDDDGHIPEDVVQAILSEELTHVHSFSVPNHVYATVYSAHGCRRDCIHYYELYEEGKRWTVTAYGVTVQPLLAASWLTDRTSPDFSHSSR